MRLAEERHVGVEPPEAGADPSLHESNVRRIGWVKRRRLGPLVRAQDWPPLKVSSLGRADDRHLGVDQLKNVILTGSGDRVIGSGDRER